MTLPIEICTGNCSDIPEVYIYVSTALKFTWYLGTAVVLFSYSVCAYAVSSLTVNGLIFYI